MTLTNKLMNARRMRDNINAKIANSAADKLPATEAPERSIAPAATTLPANIETAAGEPSERPRHISKSEGSAGERYDNYKGALFDIPGTRYRVAVCSQGYQWILQYRRGQDHWEGRKFFARKERLAKVIQEMFGKETYLAVQGKISKLPI